jgi:hypothetical protein
MLRSGRDATRSSPSLAAILIIIFLALVVIVSAMILRRFLRKGRQ